MTIVQIAALKKVKKGTRVLLLDKNGSVAKDIAKGLNGRGYKKVFVIDGGFNGWTSSKLQTRGSSSVSLQSRSSRLGESLTSSESNLHSSLHC